MQLKHTRRARSVRFDDERLVSCAGLVPVMRLAESCGLESLVTEKVSIASSARPVSKGNPGVRPGPKITTVVAGMAAGADSIDDLDMLRHGGMDRLFASVYAPSTLGSHLRAYDWGNSRQLESASRAFLTRLATATPVLAGIQARAFLDIDDARRRVYGHAKTGAGFGPAKVGGYVVKLRNLNPLVASLSTRSAAPVVAATRLRGGSAASARGARSFVTEAIGVAKAAGAVASQLVVRADSAFYNHKVIGACLDAGVRFSVTATMNPAITAAIATIDPAAWTPIAYPQAVFDEQLGCWISDAEVAECTYTAFTRTRPITARLIVRRVRDKNTQAAAGQGELFHTWRYHAVFTDNPADLITAEADHRAHAICEQLFADLIAGALAHLPSASFAANATWLTCAAITHNLLRAAGTIASPFHARARGATLRRHLITIPARLTKRFRDHIVLHLPAHWPWQDAFNALSAHPNAPPTAPARPAA